MAPRSALVEFILCIAPSTILIAVSALAAVDKLAAESADKLPVPVPDASADVSKPDILNASEL